MAKEIERKFLATIILDELPVEIGKRRKQAYLSVGDPEIRISVYWDQFGPTPNTYKLAAKSGSGLVREEVEVRVPDVEGAGFFAMTDPNQHIDKVRYTVGGWELDVFLGRHVGLVLAEIELEHPNAALPPLPPFFVLGQEVTNEAAFKNKRLATMTQSEFVYLLSGHPVYSK